MEKTRHYFQFRTMLILFRAKVQHDRRINYLVRGWGAHYRMLTRILDKESFGLALIDNNLRWLLRMVRKTSHTKISKHVKNVNLLKVNTLWSSLECITMSCNAEGTTICPLNYTSFDEVSVHPMLLTIHPMQKYFIINTLLLTQHSIAVILKLTLNQR